MAENDKLVYALVGICIGIPVGAIIGLMLYRLLFKEPVYGAQYSYTPDGKLQQYIPIPVSPQKA